MTEPREKPWTEYHTLLKRATDRLTPHTAVLELTYRCSFRCVQCYIVPGHAERELTVDEYDSVFTQLASLGTLFVILTGGEIFVRRDFFDILDLTRRHRFATHLFTNGYALTEDVLERLDGYGNLLGVSISVYGGDRESFENVTRVRGSFERVMFAIRRLTEMKIKVKVKTPLIDTNYCSIDQIREMCDELELQYKATPMITPRDDGSMEPVRHRLSDDALREYLRKMDLDYIERRNPSKTVPVCSSGRNHMAISPFGDVYPCVQIRHSAGNVRERPLEEIWRSNAFDFIRHLTIEKIPECASCSLLKYCSPCYGLGWTEHGTVYKPSQENCRFARVLKEVYEEKRRNAPAAAGDAPKDVKP